MTDNREIIKFLINSKDSEHYIYGILKTNSVRQTSEFFEEFAKYENLFGALINFQRDLERPRMSDKLYYKQSKFMRYNNEI